MRPLPILSGLCPCPPGGLAGISVLHTGIANVLMYSAYPQLTTLVIDVLMFVYPLVAIIIDWAIYDHSVGIAQAAGMILIVLGTLASDRAGRLPIHNTSSI